MHRCHRVSKGPSRCREIQMDRSYSSTTPQERSSLQHMIHMLCSHPYRRHTHQPHKECMMSHQQHYSDQMSIQCTRSRHQSPGQPHQLHTNYSSLIPQPRTDHSHNPHTASTRRYHRHSAQQHTPGSCPHLRQHTARHHTHHTQWKQQLLSIPSIPMERERAICNVVENAKPQPGTATQ